MRNKKCRSTAITKTKIAQLILAYCCMCMRLAPYFRRDIGKEFCLVENVNVAHTFV